MVVECVDGWNLREESNDWEGFGEEDNGECGDRKAGGGEVVTKEGELALQEFCSPEDSCHIGFLARYTQLQAEIRPRLRAGSSEELS